MALLPQASPWIGGDSDKVTVESGKTLSANDDFSHVYSKAGTYTITIISEQMEVTKQQIPEFNFFYNRRDGDNRLKVVSIDTPLLNTKQENFGQCFYGCTALQNISEGLFDKNTQITIFAGCFGKCKALKSIPKGLFDKNLEVTIFNACFTGCETLQSIPKGLFDNNTKATAFSDCFNECTALKSVPEGLFDKNKEARTFGYCFSGCKKLFLNKKIFSTSDYPYDIFAGKEMRFEYCFFIAGYDLEGGAGTAPDLWNYKMGNKAWETRSCFTEAENLTNWNDIPAEWGGPKSDKAIMKLTVVVEEGNLSFNIPFPTIGTIPANITVNWGDGNGYVAAQGAALTPKDGFNHIYSMAGDYIITITSDQTSEAQQQIPDFNFGKNRNKNANASKLLSVNTPLLNTGATDFSKCFYDCQALESIPEGLFAKQTKAEDFNSCFYNCSKLTLNSKIFSTSNSPYGLFTGRNMDFGFCFYNTGSAVASSASGIAPDLWNYEMGNKAWVTNNCFTSSNKLSNWNDIPADWGGPKKVDKVSMKLTVTVEDNSGLGFSIPFPVIGTTPAKMTVDWGDGKKVK